MSEVIVRGLKIPKCCGECHPFFEKKSSFPDYSKRCLLGAELPQPWFLQYEKRADECPLLEVRPHGDLVDRNEVKRIMERFYNNARKMHPHTKIVVYLEQALRITNAALDRAAVVIPAESEKP